MVEFRRREFVHLVTRLVFHALDDGPVRFLHALQVVALITAFSGCPPTEDDGSIEPAIRVEDDPGEVIPVRANGLLVELEVPESPAAPRIPVELGQPRFVDAADELGVEFVLDNGASPAMLMMQSTSGGASWLDFDADGWSDLFFAQGGYPFDMSVESRPPDDVLFRNMAGKRFLDVSGSSIPGDKLHGQGAVAGDFDNDGFDDVYISNAGSDLLYHNLGDGTFENVTEAAGVDNPLWSTSAAWYDLDLDGDLDLYVCNYLDYDPLNPIACLNPDGTPSICHPRKLDAVPNTYYANQGDGTFLEQSDALGLNAPNGKSLGVAIADLTGDGMPDVFVANDTVANHLFVNQGGMVFKEQALALGCALSGFGQAQANMGIGFADFDENGFPDLYVTHFTSESNTLYANFGPAGFEDDTRKRGLHTPTLPYLAFGTVMSDFDCDGHQDVYVANGHIDDWREEGDLWKMPAQLFNYDGETWHECSADAGEHFQRLTLSRAVASADYDHDGDMDLAVVHQNDPSSLLRNDSKRGHWLQLQFIGRDSNRRGVGVRVTLVQEDRRLIQELAGGTSYCAGHQPALFFGLGELSQPCDVLVEWPSGRKQQLGNVNVDQILVIDEQNAKAL